MLDRLLKRLGLEDFRDLGEVGIIVHNLIMMFSFVTMNMMIQNVITVVILRFDILTVTI